MRTYTHLYINTHTYVYIYICLNVYVYTYTSMYIYIYVCCYCHFVIHMPLCIDRYIYKYILKGSTPSFRLRPGHTPEPIRCNNKADKDLEAFHICAHPTANELGACWLILRIRESMSRGRRQIIGVRGQAGFTQTRTRRRPSPAAASPSSRVPIQAQRVWVWVWVQVPGSEQTGF